MMNYAIFFTGVLVGALLVLLLLKMVGAIDDYQYYRRHCKHGKLRALHLATKHLL